MYCNRYCIYICVGEYVGNAAYAGYIAYVGYIGHPATPVHRPTFPLTSREQPLGLV